MQLLKFICVWLLSIPMVILYPLLMCFGYSYEQIYTMDEFDDTLSSHTPNELACLILYGDFRISDNYFTFDGHGNLYSFNYVEDYADLGDVADYIIDNDQDFGDDEIREVLDDEDE